MLFLIAVVFRAIRTVFVLFLLTALLIVAVHVLASCSRRPAVTKQDLEVMNKVFALPHGKYDPTNVTMPKPKPLPIQNLAVKKGDVK